MGHAQLVEGELLSLSSLGVDDEPSALAVHRHRTIADLAEEEDRLARGVLEGELELALAHLLLEGLAQGVLRAEEAIRRHHALDPLVRSEVVVVADPVPQPRTRVGQVLGLGPVPEFIADALPQPLALAQRLGVMRAADHVLDALAIQELLEGALAAPGVVLAPLVAEHLPRLAEARDALQ